VLHIGGDSILSKLNVELEVSRGTSSLVEELSKELVRVEYDVGSSCSASEEVGIAVLKLELDGPRSPVSAVNLVRLNW
jgi:hypothetical protein